jgi:hypothetical protein
MAKAAFLPAPKLDWNQLDDTLIASHCLWNLWSHSLKSLRRCLLCVGGTKEDALREAVTQARRICRTEKFQQAHGVWRIADSADPHWPGIHDEPWGGWWHFDMWLPGEIARRAPEFLPPAYHPDGLPFTVHPWNRLCRDYNVEDTETTYHLWQVCRDGLAYENLWPQYHERMALARITYGMEAHGVSLRPKVLMAEIQRYKKTAAEAEAKAKHLVSHWTKDLNLRSPQQMAVLLFEQMGLPVIRRNKPSKRFPQGSPNTEEAVINRLLEYMTDEDGNAGHGGDYDAATRSLITQFLRLVLFSRRNTKAHDYLAGYRDLCFACSGGDANLGTMTRVYFVIGYSSTSNTGLKVRVTDTSNTLAIPYTDWTLPATGGTIKWVFFELNSQHPNVWGSLPLPASIVPVSGSTLTESPAASASAASGHSRTGRPMLIEFLRNIRAKDFAITHEIPAPLMATGACSRLEPRPKFLPPTTKSPFFTIFSLSCTFSRARL